MQLTFLAFIQRVLTEGQFTATYKFALLVALADLAVESGILDDRRLRVPVTAIAEKATPPSNMAAGNGTSFKEPNSSAPAKIPITVQACRRLKRCA